MPTLREFVNGVLNENNIISDPDRIIKMITDIARERAIDHVAAISDDEVRQMVIDNAGLANKLAEEKRLREQREQELKAQEEARKKAQKEEEKLQKERDAGTGEQLTLGLFGEK